MRITVLLENSSASKELTAKHGLCLHIQTKQHSILFDVGPDDTFIHNAKKLNVDLTEVDTVVISHGHKDHGGGLEAFLSLNQKAKIYVSQHAFEPHYASLFKLLKVGVGLDPALKGLERVVLTEDLLVLDDELVLISHVEGQVLRPKSNRNLLMKTSQGYAQDDFRHEQHLILNIDGKQTLISGCSHTGIVNILSTAKSKGYVPNMVLAGLHLFNPLNSKVEPLENIQTLGLQLLASKIQLYTFHCTGEKAYKALKPILGDRIQTLKSGDRIEEAAHEQ